MGSERRLLLVRPEQRFLVEEDRGEALLPTPEPLTLGAPAPDAPAPDVLANDALANDGGRPAAGEAVP